MSTAPEDPASDRPPPAGGRRLSMGGAAAAWFLALLAGVTWWLAIPAEVDFSFDDREAVVGNPVVEGELPWTAALDRDYWHHVEDAGHYRPLATLLLRFDHARSTSGHARSTSEGGPPDPRAFRVTNVVLHALIVLALGLALARLDALHGLPFPWFGLGLFAVHPSGADVVAWISGRTSLVSAAGAAVGLSLLSAIARGGSQRAWALAALGGFLGVGIALLGKEDGIVLAVVLPMLAWALGGRRAGLSSICGAATAVAIYLALRSHALGDALPSSPSAPLAAKALLERVAVACRAWAEGWLGWLWPWPPPPPSLAGEPAVQRALILPIAAFALFTTLALASTGSSVGPSGDPGDARARRALRMGAVGVLGLVVCWLPLAQIVPAGEVFAQRFLYQPMLVGVFVPSAVATLLGRSLLGRTAVTMGCVLVLLGCAAISVHSARDYTSRLTYWSAFLPAAADDARVQNAVGEALREAGQVEAAEARFRRAHDLRPAYSPPITNLGTLAMRRADWEEARKWLERAVAAGPSKPVAHANLGNVLLRLGRAADAVPLYRRAHELAPGRGAYARGLARALLRTGDVAGARTAIDAALALDRDDELSLRLHGEIQMSQDGAIADD